MEGSAIAVPVSVATEWPWRVFGTRTLNGKLPRFSVLSRKQFLGLLVPSEFFGPWIPKQVAAGAIGYVSELGNRGGTVTDFNVANRQLAASETVEKIPAVCQVMIV